MTMAKLSKKELRTKHNLQHCQRIIDECKLKVAFDVYDGVPFCSKLQDHKSWGAYVDTDGSVNFKIFTFLDAQKVFVEIKHSASVLKTVPLEKKFDGIFEIKVSPDVAKEGDRYKFVIERANHPPIKVRDPYSMRQDDLSFWSIIYNHHRFEWSDDVWQTGKNKARVSRKADEENRLAPVASLRIYEVNIATLTDYGTFHAAKKEFKKIAEEKNFNAVEIMPVENTYGYNWGYDGVDKFAVSHTLGGPDKLKELIDYAHSLSLNVIMDIVPNHLGVDMANLQNAGPYIDGMNDFGYKLNFEKDNNKFVREFIINAGFNWIENYHCDGLRVDMTKFMKSDFTLKQMVAEINYHCPHIFLIAEDGRDNDLRVTKPFTKEEIFENENEHCLFVNKIAYNQVKLESLGFDSEWDFLFHKQIAAAIIGKWDYRIKNIQNLDYAIKNSGMRVKYPMSHDEIGNMDGTRLITKIMANELDLVNSIVAKNAVQKGQRVAHVAHSILKSLVTGELEAMSEDQLCDFCKQNYLTSMCSVDEVKKAYNNALNLHRLAVAKTYSVPGPKMIFQGDENANMSYFKFFRKLSTGYEKDLESKGYAPTIKAFLDSKLNSIEYVETYKQDLDFTEQFTKDLNGLMANHPALQSGSIVNTVCHNASFIHSIHCKKDSDEIFSISNFNNIPYFQNYSINFPEGNWQEVFNSDDKKYGNRAHFLNKKIIASESCPYSCLSIAPYGISFFKRIFN